MEKTKTNRFLSLKFPALLAVFFLSFLFLLTPARQQVLAFSGGDGSSGNPYQISNAADLASLTGYLGSDFANTYFIVTDDIDLENASWTPIGGGTTSITRFYGHFDGDSHTISNLYVNRSGVNYAGLFGSSVATISNLNITGADVTGGDNTGILVGANFGTISNCSTAGSVTGSYWRIGGLVGAHLGGTISDSSSSATVTSTNPRVGGLVGENQALITGCSATGNVTVTGSNANSVGGLVGVQFSGTGIVDSYATGAVSGYNSIGGLVGDAESGSNISGSYATGNVTSSHTSAGGLVGYASGISISNSYARGAVNNTFGWYSGGLIGGGDSSTVTNCYSSGLVTSPSAGGGLIGQGTFTVTSSYWDTETSGWDTSNGGTGKTTAEMKTQSTFSGWNFSSTWSISSSINAGYPYLAWEPYNPPNDPTSLGGSSLVDNSWGNDSTPTLSFSLSDDDAGNTVSYRIQIDDSADFSSPVVDYTSALAVQGSFSFTVGQAVGSGSYTVGSAGQTLADGSYYWQVKTISSSGLESNYSQANGGSVAFRVDATAPAAPDAPATTTPTTDTTPTWDWTAATDSGSGLATPAYAVRWSEASDFSSDIETDTAPSNSYAMSTALSVGTWYFQVKATDNAGNASDWSTSGEVVITAPPSSSPAVPTDSESTEATAKDNSKDADDTADTEEEKVEDVEVEKVQYSADQTSITIKWKTNIKADSKVKYGLQKDNLDRKKTNKKEESKHQIVLRDLTPDTEYFFKIYSKEDDDNKDHSRIHSIRTLPAQNTETANLEIPGYTGNSKPNACSYTVEPGDNLWNIAQKIYGDAQAYALIIELNQEQYPSIQSKLLVVGQELTFNCNQNELSQNQESKIDASNNAKTSQAALPEPASNATAAASQWWNPFSWF